MKYFNVPVKVIFNDFEGGFWGLITEDDKKFIPTSFPDQLKYEGSATEVSFEVLDQMSSYSWGEVVHLIAFRTIK